MLPKTLNYTSSNFTVKLKDFFDFCGDIQLSRRFDFVGVVNLPLIIKLQLFLGEASGQEVYLNSGIRN